MEKRRVVIGLVSGLLVLGGFAVPAGAQTDPGVDPNEGGVTETASLRSSTA